MQGTLAANTKGRLPSPATVGAWAPVIGLVAIVVVMSALTKGEILSATNLKSLTNQVLVTALVGVGAVFVFAAGAFDMSLSGSVAVATVIGAKVALATGSIPMALAACLAVSLGVGLVKGLLAAFVKIPFFILTIVIGSLLTALVLVIMGTDTVLIVSTLADISDLTVVNVITLGGFFLLALVLFNYTRLGKSCKLIGGNEVAARQSGISLERTRIMAFLVSAMGVGLAAFIVLLRTRTASPTTGATVGLDVIVALVLGGMPLSGGPRSRISAALVGAATITVLNSGLAMLGLGNGTVQIVRGATFLAVVLLASLGYRSRLLPR